MEPRPRLETYIETLYYALLNPTSTNEEWKEATAGLPAMRQALAEDIGLLREYHCLNLVGAVWYGDKPLRVYSFYNAPETGSIEIERLLSRISNLEDSARSLFGKDRARLGRCMDAIYSAFGHALGAADVVANPNSGVDKRARSLLIAQDAMADAQAIFRALAQRQAQLDYFKGMLFGAAVLALLSITFSVGAESLPRTDTEAVDILGGCILFGALGAVFSVLSRMHGGRLKLKVDAGQEMLWLLGAIRPVVGAVAGVALFLFIDGQAFDLISGPDDSARAYSYFAALAFLGGFSERWFQDMLVARVTEGEPHSDATLPDNVAGPVRSSPSGSTLPPDRSSGESTLDATTTQRPSKSDGDGGQPASVKE